MARVFAPEDIWGLAREYGVVERQRQLDIVPFVAALVLARDDATSSPAATRSWRHGIHGARWASPHAHGHG